MLTRFGDDAFEVRRLEEGRRHMAVLLAALEREYGELLSALATLRSLEPGARASLDEHEMRLLRIQVSIRNNRHYVAGLLGGRTSSVSDATARDVGPDSWSRTRSISVVREELYPPYLAGVDVDDYLHLLTTSLLELHDQGNCLVTSHVDVAGIALPIDRAILCGLLVSELVTNSLLHAFPGGRRGAIQVALRAVGEAIYRLTVADNGIGLAPGLEAEPVRSLGLDLVYTFAAQLGGTVEVTRAGGTVFDVRFPAAP